MQTISVVLGVLVWTGCDRVLGLDRDSACIGGNGSGIVGPFRVCLDGEEDFRPGATLSTGTPGTEPGDCTRIVVQTDTLKTEVCVIAAPSIVLNSPITITGNRPLVLAATGELTILVDLDLASRSPASPSDTAILGPGASYAGCPEVDGTGSNADSTGSGGGAGGSFGSIGGDGGNATASGAVAIAPMPLNVVRGGCDGGRGGSGAGTGGGGSGGRSGGAVYLIAGTTLRIAATINTSASAGLGGGRSAPNSHTSGGGGGGGSGGLIGMDAPEVILEATARLISNGGGGGGGGGGGSQMAGVTTTAGTQGTEARTSGSAPFGTSGGLGGELGGGGGGAGAAGETAAARGSDRVISGGGGGGGGGAGLLVVFAETFDDRGAIVSPAIQVK